MTRLPAIALVLAVSTIGPTVAQEQKAVPKDSVRLRVPGCAKGYSFTAGRPSEDQPGGTAVPEGTHLRMNGPRKIMAEIKGNEGSRIEITGLVKKGQAAQPGIGIGGGVRVGGGGSGPAVGMGSMPTPGGNQLMIDVEGWRRIAGDCPR